MDSYHIVLDGTRLCNWNGGTDFLANLAAICRDVQQSSERMELTVSVMLPYLIPKYESVLRKLLGKTTDERNKHIQFVTDTVKRANPNVRIVYLRKYDVLEGSESWAVRRLVRTIHADCVVGVTGNIYDHLPVPWVSYIPDFQHKYLPQFFLPSEIEGRNKTFAQIAEASPYFIATSLSHRSDLMRYAKISPDRIFTMPFAPIAADAFLDTENVDIGHYQLPEDYFLISNQFWQHKSHKTAIQALKLLHERGYSNLVIACTGSTEDYRNEGYISEIRQMISDLKLEKHFRILGLIPKLEQIEVMKHARALIQPSLFEGDPGGCSTYDAVGLDIPVILSDIPVNLEAKEYSQAYYFQAENPEDMAWQMETLLHRERHVYSRQEVLQKRAENASKLKTFFEDMIISICGG